MLWVLAFSLVNAGCQPEPKASANSDLKVSPTIAFIGGQPQLLPGAKPLGQGSPSGVGGTWLARAGDTSFTIRLVPDHQGLRGFVSAADGSETPIKIGIFSDDSFLFETTADGTGWLWSGELSSESLKGYRENVQTGLVEAFTAQRSQ